MSPGIFLQRDPAGYLDSVNVYAALKNDPTNRIDPTGTWSSEGHDALIWHAFIGRGVKPSIIQQIQQASRDFDARTQALEDSPVHSMRAPGQSAAEAKMLRDNFISEQLISAQMSAQSGDVNFAIKLYGEAMHPVMDSSSPEHTDESGNPRVWYMANFWHHGWTEKTLITNEGSGNITPRIYSQMDQALRNYFYHVFGMPNGKMPDEADFPWELHVGLAPSNAAVPPSVTSAIYLPFARDAK